MAIKLSRNLPSRLDPLQGRMAGFRKHILGRVWPNILAGRQDVSGRAFEVSSRLEPKIMVAGFIAAELRVVQEAALGCQKAVLDWQSLNFQARAMILAKAGEGLRKRELDLALALHFSSGISPEMASAQIRQVISVFTELDPENLPSFTPDSRNYGVVGLICDDGPGLLVLARMAAAALLAGNGIIMRPTAENSLTGILFAEGLISAGLPEGLISLVCGPDAGMHMASIAEIDFILHVGPAEIGVKLQRKAQLNRFLNVVNAPNMAIIGKITDISGALKLITKMAGPHFGGLTDIWISSEIAKEFAAKARKTKLFIPVQVMEPIAANFAAANGLSACLFSDDGEQQSAFKAMCRARVMMMNPQDVPDISADLFPPKMFLMDQKNIVGHLTA